ncbi:MAG: hypothetical protein MUF73_08765 [Rhodobacteraceae bacterium]|jgi:hypothetical protein|nr:hypothetical protein [Paracoccaceae bacterium]
MTHTDRRLLCTVAAAALAASVCAGAASAQDTGGLQLTAEGAVRLSFDDNPSLLPGGSDAETSLSTRLSFGLSNESRVSRLNLRVSGNYVLRDGGTDDAREFLGPDITLGYRREGASSDFELSASRSERDVRDTFSILSDPTDPLSPTDLIVDEGTVVSTDISARLRTGIEGPFGFDLGVRASQQEYANTTNPDLENSETVAADVAFRARLSPVVVGRLTAGASEVRTTDAEDSVVRTVSLGTGLTYAIDPVRELDLTAGIVRIETTETIAAVRDTRTEEGLTFGLSYVEARLRGAFSVGLTQDFLSSGALTSLTVGQRFEQPLGALDYALGIARTDDGDLAPVGRLAYAREGRNSNFSTNLTAAVVPDDEEPVSTVSLGMSYGQGITDAMALSLTANFGVTRPLGDSLEPERRVASFEAGVTRELTRDWGLAAGYIGRYSHDDGEDSAWSNGAFMEIRRSFSIRP